MGLQETFYASIYWVLKMRLLENILWVAFPGNNFVGPVVVVMVVVVVVAIPTYEFFGGGSRGMQEGGKEEAVRRRGRGKR